ncbi:MAG: protease-4 [Candidatus Nanohaloarchaea archaeon]|jgi:protease-4
MDKYFFAGAGVLVAATILTSLLAASGGNSFTGQQKAAIIPLDGAITSTSDSFNPQSITPSRVRELNSKARNSGASVVIYEWNSGGGAVVASKDIRREIESLDMKTVCRFRDAAASGAYLASLGCDRIVADSASITGSIGVKSSYMEFSGLMDELGIEYVNITSGSLKDAGSPYKNITDQEREVLQEKTDIIHREFVADVKSERNLNQSQVEEVRTGEIFLGTEAKELGLVDTLGGRQVAIREAENLTGTELRTETIEIESDLSLLSLLNANSNLASILGNSNVIEASWR